MNQEGRHQALVGWRSRLRTARSTRAGDFVRPVLTLVTGTVVAQAIVLAGRPVLTRLFTPDEFGVLVLFTTIVTLYAVVGTGRFEDALMLPARRADAMRLLALAMGVAALSALVLTLVVVFARGAVIRWLDSPDLAPSLLLLPVAAVATGWGMVLEAWLTRAGRFRRISTGRAVQSVVVVGVHIAAGLAGAGALGLTAGVAAGAIALLLVVAAPLLGRDGILLRAALRTRHAAGALARRYRRFPAFTAPAALLNTFSARAPVFGLAAAHGAASTGLYGVAFSTLALPVGVLTNAVGQVFFAHAAAAHRSGSLGGLTRQVHRRLALTAAYPLVAVAVAGPEAFSLVFGAQWAEAGVYARMLAPWLFVSAVVSPLGRVIDVLERQRADLAFSVLQGGALIAALAIASAVGDSRVTVAAASATGTVLRLAQGAWILTLANVSVRPAAGDLARALATTTPFIGLAWAVGAATGSPIALLAALAVCGLGFYGLAARSERLKAAEPRASFAAADGRES